MQLKIWTQKILSLQRQESSWWISFEWATPLIALTHSPSRKNRRQIPEKILVVNELHKQVNEYIEKRYKMTDGRYPFWGWRTIPLGFSKQKVLLASTQCWASILRCRPSRSETNRQSRMASNQYSFLQWKDRIYHYTYFIFTHTAHSPIQAPWDSHVQLLQALFPNKRGLREAEKAIKCFHILQLKRTNRPEKH